MNDPLRLHLLCFMVVAAAGLLLLFSPPPRTAAEYCGWWMPLPPGGALVNCDSRSYVEPAQNPRLLLSAGHMRQSRPLYILAGSLLGNALGIITAGRLEMPFFWGYVALNFLLLEFSLYLFISTCRPPAGEKSLALAGAGILAVNWVTKNYLWTPHQQMFSILTPLLALHLCRQALRSPTGPARAAAGGLLTGLLALVYGNFAVLVPCLLAGMMLHARSFGRPRPGLLVSMGVLVLTAALPTLAWMLIVRHFAGSYYNHEMETYRQLIWMADALRLGPAVLLLRLGQNSVKFAATLTSLEVWPFAVLAGAAVLARKAGARPETPDPAEAGTLLASLIVLVAVTALFWLLGYYHDRLTFTLTPVLLVVAALEVSRRLREYPRIRRLAGAAAGLLTGIWCLGHAFWYGPFW